MKYQLICFANIDFRNVSNFLSRKQERYKQNGKSFKDFDRPNQKVIFIY